MNAVEIEEAISELAEQPFDAVSFPYTFLEAFGNKETTIRRLISGGENKSDVENAVLQRNNIHIAVCDLGDTTTILSKLRASPATVKAKAKFILATDGFHFEAEDLITGETVACEYVDFPNHFGFFLALAGISTVKQIRESSFDIRATSRLNRLYVELLSSNPEWGTAERRHDMNHFMARLIFCFFSEDTDIFDGSDLFTATIEQMSAKDASDINWVISEIFRAMNTKQEIRATSNFRPWAIKFPYVNGGLFSGNTETPKFTKIARSYLLHVGKLDWTKINPDIFGSMIQAVADDDERGALGMHYTSVPNILKVLNPLFLDDLRVELESAGENQRKLLNLRKRMAHIRVFDPACGSGNFLVIAYKQMRGIEAEINKRRSESHFGSEIPLTNFRGIELRSFSAEIARLALIIAEYQCDVLYRGQKEALAEFLPLDSQNWITCGNALRMDWLAICPPTGAGVKLLGDDLFNTPLDQAEIDFENEGGETYICGNPPYIGATVKVPKKASKELKEKIKADEKIRKADLQTIFQARTEKWKSLDYVAAWLLKAADYGKSTQAGSAFVATNSICQGQQVAILWPLIYESNHKISFAHTSFKWTNLASKNAGVTVVIVGISNSRNSSPRLYSADADSNNIVIQATNINPYLIIGPDVLVSSESKPISSLDIMLKGNQPTDDGNLSLNKTESDCLISQQPDLKKIIRPYYGSHEFINGEARYCIWVSKDELELANSISEIRLRFDNVQRMRLDSTKATTNKLAATPYLFDEIRQSGKGRVLVVPSHSSEVREYLPVGYLSEGAIVSNAVFFIENPNAWAMAIIASRLHLKWIATVCGQIKTDFRYSNTLGWNTFPLPKLTEKNKDDLTRCAEDILLAREAHFPATIADLYDPDDMPENLRHAHERNDEMLERIYIGRRFKNDTERLEKLFDLYTKMTSQTKKG